ncbi:MAG TPA: D-alanyl-D-alanine carboxypeptidase [Candidatus Paceibacterota bacterium]|nr:D-alanyl-D-alanine carboxypeptidase [Candidatus Paceibacterota bacterium]
MDSFDLQKLAQRTRSMREAGVALIVASGLLAVFLFIPLAPQKLPPSPITVATSTAPNAFAQVPLEAKAAIVYDLATKQVLYAKNADAQLPLASLTKLLTVYAALSELSPNTPITIPADVTHLDAPHAFNAGQTFSLADLARLTLTASLNDGAAAISEATAARENRTQAQMLAGAAAALDLAQTYAVNGNGLDVSTALSGGYGSAANLAVLAGALVNKAPTIAAATTQSSAQAVSEGGTAFSVKNTDPMVGSIPNILLSKTGYTDLAGGNLALVFDVGLGHPIAVVVLGSSLKARFTDGTALVAATLAHFAGVSSL